MSKNTIYLVCLCMGAVSTAHSIRFPQLVSRQANGVVNASSFLRRAYQSSAVLDGWVYIDGGEFSYKNNGSVVYKSSDTLISIDLSKDWTNTSMVFHSTSKPSGVPSLSNGGLWVDHKNKLLYTGFAGINSILGTNTFYPQGLWSFSPDGTGGGSWQNLNGTADASFVNQPRPFDGSVASGGGSGYFLGGVGGNSSTFQTSPRGMFGYDLSSNQVTYGRSSASSAAIGTQDGAMVFVSYFGNLGIILSAGGQQGTAGGGPGGGGIPGGGGGSNSNGLASFSTVQVYNPQDQKWYDQKTSGSAPTGRMQFCMAGTPSNNQTYEILVYAGWDGNFGSSSVSFDDAYVLTLPGFYWVKANYTAANPRNGLSCNSVGGGQILTIGGVDPTQNGQNNRQNNEDNNGGNNGYTAGFDTPDPFTQGLGIFDLSTLSWKKSYSAKQGLYSVAPEIQAYYDANGRKPTAGFASSSLQSIFAQTDFSNPDDLPFPGGGGSGYGRQSNAGAIAGGVVGGLAAVSALAGFLFWTKHKHDKKNPLPRSSDDDDELQDQTQQSNVPPTTTDDTAARMEHANSTSRYPYSPNGFYHNQPQLPETATTSEMGVPGGSDGAGPSSAAEGYRSIEKQPPPAYEETERAGQHQPAAVYELPLSEVGVRESNQESTIAGIDTVVDGMRPPQELHEETSGRAELP